MWLFRKRRRIEREHSETDSLQTKLGRGIIKLQIAFAEKLNDAASKLPVKTLRRNLILFCLVGGGLSGYVAVRALTGGDIGPNAIQIDQAAVPKHFDKGGDEIKEKGQVVDEEVYGQIKAFRAYVDSLQRENKPAYDSLLLLRLGLLDSVHAIEEIYLSQSIK